MVQPETLDLVAAGILLLLVLAYVTHRKYGGPAVLRDHNGLWLLLDAPWYDLAAWLWWWLTPCLASGRVNVGLADGSSVLARAKLLVRETGLDDNEDRQVS